MSFRKQQVESLLKRTISQVLSRQISDPRIVGLVSVTHVDVSPDMHDAYIYISVVPQEHQKRTLAGLRHASGYIHTLLRKAMSIKTVPKLDFRVDESLKKEAVVLDAIRRGLSHEAPLPAPDAAATDPTDPSSEDDAREE